MQRILIQLDTDPLPSSFDRVVAVDAGVEQLFSYGGVTPDNVVSLVLGAIFTRGPADLKHTALFIGGSNVDAGETLLNAIRAAFFGPMRVSVLCDSNGSNTTAAAAVRSATRHLDPSGATALVLGGTGPVGQRAARILSQLGATVRLSSRSLERATATCDVIRKDIPQANLQPIGSSADDLQSVLGDTQLLIAAGAAGVEFLSEEQWSRSAALRVAIDLNAVPPLGLAGIGVMDKAVQKGNVTCYGAIGVGGLKMKVHKGAIQKLFESNDLVLDTDAIYSLATGLK
ncbi:MAG: NADP-dependent methylenetetrahydromethanopterin/methylenetetrahydrofolate dehydrogenase [Planctomycetaceae bacterium]